MHCPAGKSSYFGGKRTVKEHPHEWRDPRFLSRTLQRVFLMFWLISVYSTFTPITSATVEMEQMEKIPSMKKLESLELNTTKLSSNLVRMSSPLPPH